MKTEKMQTILNHLLVNRVPSKPFFVAIDGMTCSGKTTFAQNLATALASEGYHTCCISIDDFCNPRTLRYRSDEPEALQVYKYNFREEFFLESVLRPARDNGKLEFSFTALDPVTDRHSRQVSYVLYKHSVAIIEGLHMFKPIFNPYFDYRIMITVDPAMQIERARVRDVGDRHNPPEEIEDKYVNRYRPSFEFYLRNDDPMRGIDLHIINDDPESPIFEFR